MGFEAFPPFLWIARIIAVAIIFQTIEFFQIRSTFADNGIWSWQTLRREFNNYPKVFRQLLDFSLAYNNFLILLCIRLLAALSLLIHSHVLLPPVLLVSTILICLRWRGTFNGGSDYMTIIVLMILSVAAFFEDNPVVGLGCLWYLAIQSSLSYFVAGVAKIKSKNWRQGLALPGFLASAVYVHRGFAVRLLDSRMFSLLGSWFIIVFELSFPLALTGTTMAGGFVFAAFAFHLINVYVFGLNRFLFTWASTYPAIYFCSGSI